MKLHLPVRLFKALLLAVSTAAVSYTQVAHAGAMHTDVPIQTYTDFGQNKGRYVTGQRVNALLNYIRTDVDNGIKIVYTDGTEPYVISNEQGMIDFNATDDQGVQAAISPTFTVTVWHNGSIDASYGERTIGGEHALNYKSIDVRGSDVFRLFIEGFDYMLQRQSKVQTDVIWNPVTTITDAESMKGMHNYISGAGTMDLYNDVEYKSLTGGGQYIIAGINSILSSSLTSGTSNLTILRNPGFGDGVGASPTNPLPHVSRAGDSGAPTFIYNPDTKQYEFVASHQARGGLNSYARGDVPWTHNTLNSFNVEVDMSEERTVYLNAIETFVATKEDGNGNVGSIYSGNVTNADGEIIDSYQGVLHSFNTWADLSDVKNLSNWYAYGGHLAIDVEDLFFNENLIFSSTAAENKVILNADVDLGVGYVEFKEGKYTISSPVDEDGNMFQLDSAGYVLNDGTEVHLRLKNTDTVTDEDGSTHTRMTEWRVIGGGELYIDGTGDTHALLNLGGKSTVYLQQTGGHAAYNVLVNTGAKVVIKDLSQIERDFTFGAGGGTLDLNGHNHEWNNDGTADFTIHALTEEAIISNGAGDSTLTITNADSVFWGSFRDSETGSFKVIYDGGENNLAMHSIHTKLDHQDASGFEVRSGKVSLSGINTVHGLGSATGTNKNRLVNTRDWHYADAAMNVSIGSGATFELGSHARLTGDVTVATGATFIMREGVQHDWEYVEGGLLLEDVSQYAAFYGLHGDVSLAEGSRMMIEYGEGVTATQSYGGNISGAGSLSVDLGTNEATLVLAGDNSLFSGSKEIVAGNVIAVNEDALSDCDNHKWLIGEAGALGLQNRSLDKEDLADYVHTDSTGILALTQNQDTVLDLTTHQGLIIGAADGCTVTYGTENDVLEAYDHDGNADTEKAWVLGGGGGTLVVEAQLAGNHELILGNEYARGEVKLTNTSNEIAEITFTGLVTLDYDDAAALGKAALELLYTNRVYGYDGLSGITTNSGGVLLVDNISNQSFDLSEHPSLFLGAGADATLTGQVTIADGQDYKFGGSTGKLTVQSALTGAHGLVVDAQTYSGGEIHLATATGLTGAVTVMGYDSSKTSLTEGDIILSFGADNALASAESVTAKAGATIDLAGTDQAFNVLNVEAAGSVVDSVTGGELTLKSGTVSGSLAVDKLCVAGADTDSLHLAGNTQVGELTLESGTLTLGDVTEGVNCSNEITVLSYKGGLLRLVDGEYKIGSLVIAKGANYDLSTHTAEDFGMRVPHVVLAGGTLSNSSVVVNTNLRQLYAISLTDDSTIDNAARFGLIGGGYDVTQIDLAGHTLTKSGDGILDIFNTSITDGTIEITGGILHFGVGSPDEDHDSTINADILLSGGSFNIDKSGTGTLVFNGDTTEVSSLNVSNGTVSFTGAETNISSLNATGGTVQFLGDTVTFADALEVKKNGTVIIGSDDSAPTVNANRLMVYNSDNEGESNLIINSGTVNVGTTNKDSGTASGVLLGHWPSGKGILTLNGGVVNAHDTFTVISWNSAGELNINGGTFNTYGVALGGAESNTRGNDAALNLNGGRLNIGSGGITNNSGATKKSINISGGTIGTLAESWSTTVNMTLSGHLTVDTQVVGADTAGAITFGGIITGAEDTLGSVTKTGAGTLSITRAATLQNVVVEAGSLALTDTESSVAGNVSIAQGSTLTLAGGYTLGAGQTLAVTDTVSAGGAEFETVLTVNGGSLILCGDAMSADAAALQVGSVGLGSDASLTLSFTEEGCLQVGSEYWLVNGDWSDLDADNFTVADLQYLTGEAKTRETGLYVTFSSKAGSVVWNGVDSDYAWSASAFSGQSYSEVDTVIFTDAATKKDVDVTADVSVAAMLFDNTQAYSLSGSGAIATGSIVLQTDGEASISNKLTVANTTDVSKGKLTVGGTASLAETTVSSEGELSVTGSANATSLNLVDGATLSGDGSLTADSLTISGSGMAIIDTNLTINGEFSMDADSELHVVRHTDLRISETFSTFTGSKITGEAALHLNMATNAEGDGDSRIIMAEGSDLASIHATGVVAYNRQYGAVTSNFGGADLHLAEGGVLLLRNGLSGTVDANIGDIYFDGNGTLRVYGSVHTAVIADDIHAENGTINKTDGGTVTLSGVVTANEIKVSTGAIRLNNERSQISTFRANSGTSYIEGGTIGHLAVNGGTVNLVGKVTIGGNPNTVDGSIAGIRSVIGTVNVGDGSTATTIAATRVEMGDSQSQNDVLNIKQNATLIVSGGDEYGASNGLNGYKRTGFILSEWNRSTTMNVEGTLLVENAHISHGDSAANININSGGIVATKGLGAAQNSSNRAGGSINLNLNEGGTLILGEGGISANGTYSLAGGTIGITGDLVLSTDFALAASTGSAFDTQKYVWAEDGASITQGSEGGSITASGVISGDGQLIKTGAGELTVSGDNTYTGGTVVRGGVLKVGHTNALGGEEAQVSIENTGVLDINGTQDFYCHVTMAAGATLQNTANIDGYIGKKQIPTLTLTGDATVTGTSDFAMVGAGHNKATLKLAGHTLTKTGSNTFSISNTEVDAGTIKVMDGTLQAIKQGDNDYLDLSQATVEVGRTAENQVGTFRLSANSENLAKLRFDGGKVIVDSGHRLTVTETTEVKSNGGTLQGMVQLNTMRVEGALSIGDGSTKGVIIQVMNGQSGSIGGAISSNADNTEISIAGMGADNKAIVANTLIDIMKGSTLNMSNVVLQDSSRITDATATFNVNNVEAQVSTLNASVSSTTVQSDTQLTAFGASGETMDMLAGSSLLNITSSLMDTVSVTGSDFIIELADEIVLDGYEYVGITFTNTDATAATFDANMSITLRHEDNEYYMYFVEEESGITKLYAAVPEPGTATLSLLALAGLAARRRRK